MQLMDSLITLNGAQRKLYLSIEDGEDKINGFTLLAMNKMKKDFGDLPLTDVETRKKMEMFGSSIHETPINKDGRITIPEDILSKVEVKRDTEVMIKGAIEYITISKKSM